MRMMIIFFLFAIVPQANGKIVYLFKSSVRSVPAEPLPYANLEEIFAPRELKFDGREMQGIRFRGAWISGSSFVGVKAEQSDWAGARLISANFKGADLRGANFHAADLSFVNFEGADLRGARFDQAFFLGTKFCGAQIDEQNKKYFARMRLKKCGH